MRSAVWLDLLNSIEYSSIKYWFWESVTDNEANLPEQSCVQGVCEFVNPVVMVGILE